MAAVVQAARELVVEPVCVDEVEHVRVAVDADGGVVPAQHLVDARLDPYLAHGCRLVEDVTETDHSPTAAPFELLERREKLPVGPGGREIRHQQVGRHLAHGLLEELGPELDHISERQRQLTRGPRASADLARSEEHTSELQSRETISY